MSTFIHEEAHVDTQMVTSEKHQKALLSGVERLVGIDHPELLAGSGVPKLLMALYQADLIEEAVVTQWGTHVSKKSIRRQARRSGRPVTLS